MKTPFNKSNFQQFFQPDQFSNFDAIAILQVPKDKFDTLFKLNIKYEDLQDNSLNTMKYAVNPLGWFGGLDEDVSFSDAIMNRRNSSGSICESDHQQIKRDFIRHILKTITNTTRLNALFSNKTNLVYESSLLDVIV